MLSNPKKMVLRLLVGFALTMIAACGGGTKAVRNSTQALTVGGGSRDALDPRAVSLTAPGPRDCYDPADFGAVPDDGIDDRGPSQLALDAASVSGGRVCFGTGRWALTRAPVGTYNRFAALSTHGQHVEIQGAGPGTMLEVGGDQGGSTTYVISLDPGARDITIRDLVIDTSGMANTDEQTHAIAIGTGVCTTANGTCSMPVEDVSVERVRFVHPSVSGVRKGDCVALLGNTPATQVRRVTIMGSTFTSCARSGIRIQRNVNNLKVIGNQFTQSSDQDIDGEASGGQGDDGIEIIGNTFDDDVTIAQGDFSVALTSQTHAVVQGNTFKGRGLSLYRTTGVVVSGNVFDATHESSYGVIEVGNVAERMVIAGNTIRRRGVAGTAIRVVPHSGGLPTDVTISNNTITVDGDSNGIYLESAQDVTINGNSVKFATAAPNGSGVYLRATVRALDGVMISGNRVAATSSMYSAVRLHASPQPVDGVTIVGNMTRGTGQSLRCEGIAGGFRQPIVHASNNWHAAPVCTVATLVPQRP